MKDESREPHVTFVHTSCYCSCMASSRSLASSSYLALLARCVRTLTLHCNWGSEGGHPDACSWVKAFVRCYCNCC